jgi:hypothetical protein
MRMIALSALLALGLGVAATTGASAAPVTPAAGMSKALNTTSLLQDVAVRCRSVRVCRRGPYGRRCRIERVCRRVW